MDKLNKSKLKTAKELQSNAPDRFCFPESVFKKQNT